jgi:site-specific DNA-methyltransferase (adenine-specific)
MNRDPAQISLFGEVEVTGTPVSVGYQGGSNVFFGDNLAVLRSLDADAFQMVYVDPPFNTGKVQRRISLKTVRNADGQRTGFKGHRYTSEVQSAHQYVDIHDDYLGFLEPRLIEAHRVLHSTGTMYLHLDYREVHYAKVLMDEIFGRDNFLNEIIWAYDYGARSTKRWPAKHDNILVYVKDIENYWFNSAEVDREPYMAPGLVTPEKAALGKLPTDVWWHTIVSPTGKEKTGYPTQKPMGVLRRMVTASTRPGDRVLDFFAGSGTLGDAARQLGRSCVLVDNNEIAIDIMRKRLGEEDITYETTTSVVTSTAAS